MKKDLRFSMRWTARLAAVLVLAFLSVPAVSTQPAWPQNGSNLLTNGGFETFPAVWPRTGSRGAWTMVNPVHRATPPIPGLTLAISRKN